VNFTVNKKQKGTTLIELLVALVIAGIVVSLGFTVYTTITRQFQRQSREAEALRNAILIKKRIDNACRKIAVLKRCNERELSGTDQTGDSTRTVRYRNGSVFSATDTVTSGFKEFVFSLAEDSKKKNSMAVVLWEGVIAESGQWVGGELTVGR
jgi:prepilin-type N-terminal cleavage/methylation domain-containing protein